MCPPSSAASTSSWERSTASRSRHSASWKPALTTPQRTLPFCRVLSMSADQTDCNLLFGVLALQADLLDATRFAEACSAWATRKDTPLADLLVERGWLTAEDRAHLDYLL